MRAYKARRQKPVKGGRAPLPSCVLDSIREAVEEEARKFRVSRSFVIAVRLAHSYGITEQEEF
jgi:hypothetical protein